MTTNPPDWEWTYRIKNEVRPEVDRTWQFKGEAPPISGPYPSSNAAIAVPAIASLMARDVISRRRSWTPVKRVRKARNSRNRWRLV